MRRYAKWLAISRPLSGPEGLYQVPIQLMAPDMAKEAIGFGRMSREGEDEDAINKMFTPEFRNRLDAIIGFSALSTEVIQRVVDKFIIELEGQLADRGVMIELTDAARTWLGVQGLILGAHRATATAHLLLSAYNTECASSVKTAFPSVADRVGSLPAAGAPRANRLQETSPHRSGAAGPGRHVFQ